MAWKPDFTKDNPYEDAPADYVEAMSETLKEQAVELGWLPPEVLPEEAVPPAPPPVVPPPEVPLVPIHIGWIDSIFSFVWDISDWFYNAYVEVSSWWVVGPLFGTILLNVSDTFGSLLTPIAHFSEWADDVATKAQGILTSGAVSGLIEGWFPWLGDIGEWFIDRWSWFRQLAGEWWATTKPIVLGWIDIATEGFNNLIVAWDEFWKITFPQWTSKLEVLGSDVSDFFTNTLPTLFDVKYAFEWWVAKYQARQIYVDELLADQGEKTVGWEDIRDSVLLLFSDPINWIKCYVIEPIITHFLEGFDRGMKGEEKK